MVKIYYDNTHEDSSNNFNHLDWTSFKKKPRWWRNLTPFIDGIKSVTELIETRWDHIMNSTELGTPRTSKTCPGISTLFSYSIPIKFPCDIFLETREDGTYYWRATNGFMSIATHGPEQTEGSSISKDYITLKFEIPVVFMTDKPVCVSFVDPIFFNDMPYKVSPGIALETHSIPLFLNTIAFFPKKNMKYVFYKDEVCSLLQFSDKVTEIKQKDLSSKRLALIKSLTQSFFKSKAKERL